MKKLLLVVIVLYSYHQRVMAHELRSEINSTDFSHNIWDITNNHSMLLVSVFFIGIALALSSYRYRYYKKIRRNITLAPQEKIVEKSMGITVTPDIISSDPSKAKLKLALTYYKTENFYSSRELLEQIKIEGDSQQQSQAEQLLKQMNKVS